MTGRLLPTKSRLSESGRGWQTVDGVDVADAADAVEDATELWLLSDFDSSPSSSFGLTPAVVRCKSFVESERCSGPLPSCVECIVVAALGCPSVRGDMSGETDGIVSRDDTPKPSVELVRSKVAAFEGERLSSE